MICIGAALRLLSASMQDEGVKFYNFCGKDNQCLVEVLARNCGGAFASKIDEVFAL